MTAARRVQVTAYAQAQAEQMRLLSQGFETVHESSGPDWVRIVMVKRKQINVVLLVLALLFWILPGLIYLIVFSAQSDQVIEIVGGSAGSDDHAADVPSRDLEPMRPPSNAPILQMSPDRSQWWDGHAWLKVSEVTPPMAVRSEDGRAWWDGMEWRAVQSNELL